MPAQFDVLIIGGGLVGASLACALAGSGRRIGLVEAHPFDAGGTAQPSFDERTTALAWGSRRLYEQWGLWAGLAAQAAPIRALHVSQRGHLGVTRVHREDYGVEALGYVIPNRVLGRVLFERVRGQDAVELLAPMHFVGQAQGQDARAVTLRDAQCREQTLHARLVVGADGANSQVRRALGIAASTRDYDQSAVVTTVGCERHHADTAYERFTPDGPIALLPRGQNACVAVWTGPSQDARRRCQQDEGAFLGDLQAAFGYRLGAMQRVGARLAYPLSRLVCPRPLAARAVLVGNAGHTLHPAAAQGFNLALRDVAVLARLLSVPGDPGAADLIEAWFEARRPDQQRVSSFTDAIVRLFSNRVPGLGAARGLGLLGLELFPDIKHGMAR
ncbi:MAG: 2-octaprenyl-6-methoxyphenyl hydroxylase, partial [Salinisphaera sp.]|nr:2-octaprenyl-6-methoxyphenyl hydroxylase [Salinisphaera sp.]